MFVFIAFFICLFCFLSYLCQRKITIKPMTSTKLLTIEEATNILESHTYGFLYKHLLSYSGKDEMNETLEHAIKLAHIYESCKND